MLFELTALVSATSPYDMGRVFGAVVGVLLLGAGALKCFSIMRRPTTNSLCVLSLAILLLAVAAANIVRVFVVPALDERPQLASMVALMFLGVRVAMLITAVVIAIIGLVHYRRHKDRYEQGRHQAVFAVIASAVFLALILRNTMNEVRADGDGKILAVQSTGAYVAFEELNFRIRTPQKPWVRFEVEKLNSDATVGFIRPSEQVCFMVIGEQAGLDADLAADAVAIIAEAALREGSTSAVVGPKEPVVVGGMKGIGFSSSVQMAGHSLRYRHCVVSHNGFVWQLIVWGQANKEAEVAQASRDFCGRFEIIDANRVFHSDAVLAEDVVAPQFGYAFRLAGSGWHAWSEIAEDFPEAHSGALYGLTHAFGIVSLRFDGLSPTDTELGVALFGTVGFDYPGDVENKSPVTIGGAAGYAWDAAREVDGSEYVYRLNVLRTDDVAYLLAGWRLASDERGCRKCDEIASKFELIDGGVPTGELTAGERVLQSQLYQQLGDGAFDDERVVRALAYYRRAFFLKDGDEGLLNLVADVYDNLERYDEARAFLEGNIDRFPNSSLTEANLAYQLARTGERDRAIEVYQRLFDGGFENQIYFEDLLDQLVSVKRFEEAHAALDAARSRQDKRDLRFRKARLYREQEEYGKAVELLRQMEFQDTFDKDVTIELAETHYDAEEYVDARQACERLIEHGHDSAYLHWLKGSCELGLKRYAQAKASFESAVRLDPADDDYRRYLEHASGRLGRGENHTVRERIDAVELPDVVDDLLSGLPDSDLAVDGETTAAQILTSISGIHHTSTEWRRTDRVAVRILNRRGCAQYSTLTWEFDPLSEAIYVNDVVVKDAGGAVVGNGDIETFYVLDANEDQVASQDRVLYVPVPALAPGNTLEYTVTTKRLGSPEQMPFFRHTFRGSTPTRFSAIYVTGDIDRVAHEASDDIRFASSDEAVCWYVVDQPAYRWEPRQPPFDTWTPVVAIGDKGASWASEAEECLDSLSDRLEMEDDIRVLAEKLSAGQDSTDEVIESIARHVQRDYTYTAIEFGRRAHIPNPASLTVRNAYGDCKDHALLLRQLLVAAGVDANLALMSTYATVSPSLPSLDQFNHMIVHVNTGEEDHFIDCTDKHAAAYGQPSYMLADEQILVLDPENPRLINSEAYPRGAAIRSDRRVEIVDGAHAHITEALTLTRAYAAHMRSVLGDWDEDSYRDVIQRRLAPHGNVSLRSLKLEEMNEPSEPLVIRSVYLVRNVMKATPDGAIVHIPALWESDFLSVSEVGERQAPFRFSVPMLIDSEVEFIVPAGFSVDGQIATDMPHSPFFDSSMEIEQTPATIECRSSVFRDAGRYPPEQFEAFVYDSGSLQNALQPSIVLRRVEGEGL